MPHLIHELILESAGRMPAGIALCVPDAEISYEGLAKSVRSVAGGLIEIGLSRGERVGVYLPKQPETVAALFGISLAGGVFVPINPVLKAAQVGHILRDCGARVLVTGSGRLASLEAELANCHDLHTIVVVEDVAGDRLNHAEIVGWEGMRDTAEREGHRVIDVDAAAILYTSGSTGRPKGVVLSHRNMVCGAESVAQYLENRQTDRLLAALPFSFDYGFSQLSTAFLCGAGVALMDYLLPRDVIQAAQRYRITGLAAVPPLWIQLADLGWPKSVRDHLRYITNSGGAMPQAVLDKLQRKLPSTSVFLMYGLTEAFRSTYLPPNEAANRPTSMGKAIPNAEILVVREDGTRCGPGEPGELVHRGALVSLGYWNDPERTAARFRAVPGQNAELPVHELAVWSGDTVMADEEGYLYFVGRRDDMIKTSGYRVSPTEVEEVIYATGLVSEAVAVGVPHPVLGQAIAVVGVPSDSRPGDAGEALLAACRETLPVYMVPSRVEWRRSLPRNANGKIDRKQLATELADKEGSHD